MSNIDKRELREAAEKAGSDKWQAKKINGDFYVIRNGSYEKQHCFTSYQPIAEIEHKPVRDFVAAANPATVLALLDELEAGKEMVELQRFKLERQAEDLHQAKSLERIHREKRFELEREFRNYKDSAESNALRLAKDVCRLEDELISAGIRINGED